MSFIFITLVAELGNVRRACKVMGFSRDTFYRYQAAMAEGGLDTLHVMLAHQNLTQK